MDVETPIDDELILKERTLRRQSGALINNNFLAIPVTIASWCTSLFSSIYGFFPEKVDRFINFFELPLNLNHNPTHLVALTLSSLLIGYGTGKMAEHNIRRIRALNHQISDIGLQRGERNIPIAIERYYQESKTQSPPRP